MSACNAGFLRPAFGIVSGAGMLGVAITGFSSETLSNNMPESSHDDDLLLIRCPSCGQRFKVEEDLRERTVECGGCEHRFRINDEVIVRGKRFYPGERKDPRLNRFHRVPFRNL